MKLSAVKKSIYCAICIALCYVLPLAFHAVGAGSVLLPMHIPVLICGMVCGWQYGMLCGISGPAISCILTSMPPVADLPAMMVELCLYGVLSGILMKAIHTRKTYADLYISIIIAIVLGRIASGFVKALIYTSGDYSIALWVSAYVVNSWPGTLIQLVFVPTIVFALMKAHLIPERYPELEEEV